jgi:CubicO group peptidase (beta-lactamase class C family)
MLKVRSVSSSFYPDDAVAVAATPQTPFCISSASKAVTAVVAHLLAERGLIQIDDRVCDYIPEFGKHGKDAITIGHVLSHRAGIPRHPREAMNLDNTTDRELLLRAVSELEPTSRPGGFWPITR